MAARIEPLPPEALPALAEFTRNGFCRAGEYCDFAKPEVLRWSFFDPRGPWAIPRSFAVIEGGRIVAHVGVFTTAFPSRGTLDSVPAVHMVNWLTTEEASSFGTLLMLRAFSLAPVTYALGCTMAAARVLERCGFELLLHAPLFHRVLKRTNSAVWRELHGTQTVVRTAGFLGVDLFQSFRQAHQPRVLEMRAVPSFGPEVQELLARCTVDATWSSRSPDLLNHYLRFPLGNFSGYVFEAQGIRGFAIVSIISRPKLKVARIVECFLDSTDIELWADALALLHERAAREDIDLISCYGTTPWMAAALRRSGFFRRCRTAFYLRDPKKHVSRAKPFHLTHLEADLSFI